MEAGSGTPAGVKDLVAIHFFFSSFTVIVYHVQMALKNQKRGLYIDELDLDLYALTILLHNPM